MERVNIQHNIQHKLIAMGVMGVFIFLLYRVIEQERLVERFITPPKEQEAMNANDFPQTESDIIDEYEMLKQIEEEEQAKRDAEERARETDVKAAGIPIEEGQGYDKPWRKKYRAMTLSQRRTFDRKRNELKTKMKNMTQSERAEFYRYIKSRKDEYARDVRYIEAGPGREKSDTEKKGTASSKTEPETPITSEEWGGLSYQEKRDLLKVK